MAIPDRKPLGAFCLVMLPLLLSGCSGDDKSKNSFAPPQGNPERAVADVDAARAEAARPVERDQAPR